MAVVLSFVGKWNGNDLKKAETELARMRRTAEGSSGAMKRLGDTAKHIGIGVGVAAAAVGILAVKMGTDAVQAAMEEEKSVAALNKALENLGMAGASESTAKFIDDLQYASATADTVLRPALAKLATATGDITTAQDALKTSLDMAAGGYGTTESAAAALAKAYGGNLTSLRKMVPGMDKAIIASGDMNAIMDELARVVGGQSAKAVDTLSGRMAVLNLAVDELSEAFGTGLMEGIAGAGDSAADAAQKLRDMQGDAETLGVAVGGIGVSLLGATKDFGLGTMKLYDYWADMWAGIERLDINAKDFWGEISDGEGEAARKALDLADAERDAAMMAYALGDGTTEAAAGADAATAAFNYTTPSIRAVEGAAKDATTEVDKFKTSWDKVTKSMGRKESIAAMEAAIDAFAGLDGTKRVGKGKNARDVADPFYASLNRAGTDFNLRTESGRAGQDAAFALINATKAAMDAARNPDKRRELGMRGRRELADELVGIGFDRSDARAYARENIKVGASTTNYIFNGDLTVTSPADAARQARTAARLAGLAGRQQQSSAAAYGGYNG